jgi:hypothetical protein
VGTIIVRSCTIRDLRDRTRERERETERQREKERERRGQDPNTPFIPFKDMIPVTYFL